MKKYLILAAAAIAMASCSNDEGASVANDGTIRLTTDVSKAGTRTIDQTVQATQIVNGGKVFAEFTTTLAAGDCTNWTNQQTTTGAYTADGNGNLSGATVKWPKTYGTSDPVGTETVSVEAWYPFTEKPNLGSATHAVEADQSTEANYAASDYLHGASSSAFTYDKISSPILVTFQHMLSKINVKVTKSDGSSLVGAKVVFGPEDMILKGTIGSTSAVTAVTTPAAGDKGQVTMATLDATGTASCIIIPQTLASTKTLITITDADGSYSYTLAAAKTFAATKAYTYNVTIAEAGVIILSEQITDWTYEDAESVIAKQ